jgi:hypothetical protein
MTQPSRREHFIEIQGGQDLMPVHFYTNQSAIPKHNLVNFAVNMVGHISDNFWKFSKKEI